MKAKTKRQLKSAVRTLHLYIGLAFGALWLVIAVTGALITYHDEIDAWGNAQLYAAKRSAPGRLDYDGVLNAAQAAMPAQYTAYRIAAPRAPNLAARVAFYPDGDNKPDLEAFVQPASGQVNGIREVDDYWIYTLYDLHHTLLAGTVGELVVGFSAFFLMTSLLFGLYLWWPQKGAWRFAFKVNPSGPWRRTNWQLHRVTGTILLPFVFMSALTGAYMIFPDEFDAAVGTAVALDPVIYAEDVPPPTCAFNAALSLNQASAKAEEVYPASRALDVSLPDDGASQVTFSIVRAQDPRRISGAQTRVSVDRKCGTVFHTVDIVTGAPGNVIGAWIFPLHNGEAFGSIGRLVICLAAIGFTALISTGILHYVARRKKKRA